MGWPYRNQLFNYTGNPPAEYYITSLGYTGVIFDNENYGSLVARNYDSGAYRDTDNDKIKYEGHISPLVLQRFGEYMHLHRQRDDGTIREPDNWQLGIELNDYADSLIRHVVDFWINHDGYETKESMQDLLCAIIFNASGYLFELLKEEHETKKVGISNS